MVNSFSHDSNSTSSLLLQTQVALLFQIWQQHQSNLGALKDAVTAQNNAQTRYGRMKLSYVLFLIQKEQGRNISFDCLI